MSISRRHAAFFQHEVLHAMELPPLPVLSSTTTWTLCTLVILNCLQCGLSHLQPCTCACFCLQQCVPIAVRFAPGGHLAMSRDIFWLWQLREMMPLALSKWTPGMLLTSYKTQDSPPQQKSAETENPCPKYPPWFSAWGTPTHPLGFSSNVTSPVKPLTTNPVLSFRQILLHLSHFLIYSSISAHHILVWDFSCLPICL